MSFPGYIKSLKLKDKHNGKPESISRDRGSIGSRSHTRQETAEERRPSNSIDDQARSLPALDEDIRDEKQNGPSKSLWVGNIPSRTTSSEIRELFCKFGTIVSTRIQLKYAFVNFEDIESAIMAFKKYHDQDIFRTGNSTINIRFTSTLVEAKQAKEGLRERQSSMTTKAEAAQKQYFQPVELRVHESSSKLSSSDINWPNGKPPTGPKSQRREVSPPPLRRADSYRPAAPSRGSSYKSEEYRRSDKDEYRRGRSYRKHSDQHYAPTYSPSESRSPSTRTSSSIPSLAHTREQGDESPLPWERKENRNRSPHPTWMRDTEEIRALPGPLSGKERCGSDPVSQTRNNPTKEDDNSGDISLSRCLQTPEYNNDDQDPKMTSSTGYMVDPLIETKDLLSSLAPIYQAIQNSKSPSLRPIERLRVENGSIRGSSVISEVATTSSKASSKKRRCHDCRKPASDLSPVVPCSTCRRRYHSGCGDPKPSICSDKSRFVCGGCLRQRGGEAYAAAAPAEPKPQGNIHGKVHLVSPPLSLNQDGNGSANLSPRDDLTHLLSDGKRLEAFFPQTTEEALRPMELDTGEQSGLTLGRSSSISVSDAHHVRSEESRFILNSSAARQISRNEGLQKMYKYKVVTCKWWASGNCTQPEEGCYYAHERTDISFPDRKKTNKSWTCYDWLNNRCRITEPDCRFAHHDTGLHVWRDGRPSFKHVTCFWWSKGNCKWDKDSCKFAHEDTGLYSLDPADIWQGGSKFSVTRPVETSGRSSLPRQNTNMSTSTLDYQSAPDTPFEAGNNKNYSLQSRRDDKSNSSVLRPSLKVNTSSNHQSASQPSPANSLARRPPGTLGALPQTPNDDSPDKSITAKFRIPTSVNRFPQTFSDLPTPEIEDVFRLEQHQLNDHEDLRSMATVASATQDQSSPRATEDHDTRLEREQQHAHTSSNEVTPSPIVDQMRKLVADQPVNHVANSAPRDPRRQNYVQPLDTISSSFSAVPASTDSNDNAVIGPPNSTNKTNNVNLGPSDGNRSRNVKRCQNCHKPVFASLLCRVCSVSAISDDTHLEKSPIKSSCSDAIAPIHENMESISLEASEISTNYHSSIPSVPSATGGTPSTRSNLKRSASGSNVFLKNKRPKSSMIFSSSGSIRPDEFRRQPATKRPSLQSINLASRREPQPSLKDLIQEERAKNMEKRGDYGLETGLLVESPVSDGEKENEAPNSPEEQPLVETRASVDTEKDDELRPPASAEQRGDLTHGDGFRSPLETSHEQDLSILNSSSVVDDESRSRPEPEESRPVQTKSYLPTQWRSSESPQPDANLTKPLSTIKTPSRSRLVEHAHISPMIENKINSPPQGQKKSPTTRRLSSKNVAANSEGIKWASAITCTQCQKNHKKCLHDNVGALDAHKCRDYVLSRDGRPDTGRSRSEWNAIIQASELDPNSDDEEDLLDDEDMQTSGSEDEFATAVGGDEMLVESEHDEHEVLLEKFKKPLLPSTRLSPAKSSPTAVSKFFLRGSDEGWTAADETSKKAALTRKGVMFESDSEDDDYLSDESEAPITHERPYDPLHVPPKVSKDLFAIAPELDHNHVLNAILRTQQSQGRPSRKQQWSELRSRQLQQRRERFGNPHWEVNRVCPDVMVSALVERVVPPKNMEDRFAVGSVQTREEKMSFSDFLGVPKLPEICLMNDGERLGFRDGQKERDRVFGRTGRGLGKRSTDDEKWPVRTI